MIEKEKIIQYYKNCDISYQHWGEHAIYEMHYGYWDETIKNHAESLTKMHQFLSQRVGINSEDRILDAGCGVGAMSIWLAQHYKDIKITGINISKNQVDKANIFANKYKVSSRVNFLEKDYLNTGFTNESFNIVLTIESVCHSEDKNDFIREAYRILKPGGKLILNDYFMAKEKMNLFKKKMMHWHLSGWVIPNLATKEKFLEGLKNTGFKNIQCSDITANILPSSKIMFKRGFTGLFADKIFKHKNKIQYANTITCFFQYITLKMGLWKYLIFYAEK